MTLESQPGEQSSVSWARWPQRARGSCPSVVCFAFPRSLGHSACVPQHPLGVALPGWVPGRPRKLKMRLGPRWKPHFLGGACRSLRSFRGYQHWSRAPDLDPARSHFLLTQPSALAASVSHQAGRANSMLPRASRGSLGVLSDLGTCWAQRRPLPVCPPIPSLPPEKPELTLCA